MPLVDLDLPISAEPPPREVREFLREAERRIEAFQIAAIAPAFVPSTYPPAYNVLRAVAAAHLTPGRLFCEWGSGFGVIACLAAFLEYDACGIEIEATLVDEAQRLAADFDLPVEFIRGSFIPEGAPLPACTNAEFGWLATDEPDAHEELGLHPEDFTVIFAYPWPDEERVIDDLFEQYAAHGAILVTHHGGDNFRVRRKRR